MGKPITTLTTILLGLLAIGQAFWLWKAINVTVAGVSLPIWVPIAGFLIALVTSVGIMLEARRRGPEGPTATDASGEATSRDVQRRPGKFTVHKGKRYKAKIALSFFEQMASNDMIVEKFQEAGFTEVSVTGTGDTRIAIGRWASADTSAQMPSQVVSATEIVEPTVVASLTKAADTLSKTDP